MQTMEETPDASWDVLITFCARQAPGDRMSTSGQSFMGPEVVSHGGPTDNVANRPANMRTRFPDALRTL